MRSVINEIHEMKYLLGYKRGVVISEQPQQKTIDSKLGDIYYQRCEGGEALIDPESYTETDTVSEDGKPVIKFVKEPRIGKDVFNNGESDSIGTCLGGDIPLIGRCWSILDYNGQKQAFWEVDCSTGKDK